MLSDFTPSATVAVKNLQAVRSFYEGILGFEPIGSTLRRAPWDRPRSTCSRISQAP